MAELIIDLTKNKSQTIIIIYVLIVMSGINFDKFFEETRMKEKKRKKIYKSILNLDKPYIFFRGWFINFDKIKIFI